MKIATLSNASVVHTPRWVRHFRARGHDVRVWSLEPGPADLEARALPRAPLPGVLRYPLATPALRRELAAFGPDLVDAHFVPNYGLLGVLTGMHPLSVCAWGSDLLVDPRRDALRRARTRFVLRRADLVLTDAEMLADSARSLGAPPERVHSIPWGVSRARFHPRGARIPGRFLSARMHEPVYDLPTLFDGLAPLFHAHAHLTLEVAGDGSLRAAMERHAARVFPVDRVRFLGRVDPDRLAVALAESEFYLSASRSDSTSVSLLEAMASGSIPVVSDLPGNREWVREGEGARCFAMGDVAGVTAAVRRALDDPPWCEAARARNAAVIAERGDWDVQMEKIETLFETLVRDHRNGARGARGGSR